MPQIGEGICSYFPSFHTTFFSGEFHGSTRIYPLAVKLLDAGLNKLRKNRTAHSLTNQAVDRNILVPSERGELGITSRVWD
ncbi:MAG: hypothetical protein COB93_05100 [Sneathiella sp.]|nr:MAG: hypothetical protein COB93_05100 [Sneathiella sp.]